MVAFRLSKQAKLVKTDDFSSVFNLRKRIANKYLVMRYRQNDKSCARLGLIVAKKTAKLAVQRNYMRRVLRELFRLRQHELPAVDLVIQVQNVFDKPDFIEINDETRKWLMPSLKATRPATPFSQKTLKAKASISAKPLKNLLQNNDITTNNYFTLQEFPHIGNGG